MSHIGRRWEVRVQWPDKPCRAYDKLLGQLAESCHGHFVLADFGPLLGPASKLRKKPRPYRAHISSFSARRLALRYLRKVRAEEKTAELGAEATLHHWEAAQVGDGEVLVIREPKWPVKEK